MKKHKPYMYQILLTCLLLTGSLHLLQAQAQTMDSSATDDKFQHDSNYYTTYDRQLTVRALISRKYASLDLWPRGERSLRTKYEPNSPLTMGVGATYRWLTVNVVYGFRFLNTQREDRGKTKSFDLQAHLLGRRATTDIYLQRYKGYYTNDVPGFSPFLVRGDMRVAVTGIQHEIMTNWRRFSMRSAINQSERQLRSAGTPLIGFGVALIHAQVDSSLPLKNDPQASETFTRLDTWEFGPSLGYAYNLVFAKNFFLMGALSLQVGLNTASLSNDEGERANFFALRPDATYRTSLGYLGNNWGASFLWQGQVVRAASKRYNYEFDSGRVLFALTKKINIRKERGVLKLIERIDNKYLEKLRSKKYQ